MPQVFAEVHLNLLNPDATFLNRQKAKRLRDFCSFVANFKGDFYRDVTREQLLAIDGIGRETADSILLYACNRPFFVVDAYTRRLLVREKIISGKEKYDEIREMFEKNLPKDIDLYKEFHALIVENEKFLRTKKPESNTTPSILQNKIFKARQA